MHFMFLIIDISTPGAEICTSDCPLNLSPKTILAMVCKREPEKKKRKKGGEERNHILFVFSTQPYQSAAASALQLRIIIGCWDIVNWWLGQSPSCFKRRVISNLQLRNIKEKRKGWGGNKQEFNLVCAWFANLPCYCSPDSPLWINRGEFRFFLRSDVHVGILL